MMHLFATIRHALINKVVPEAFGSSAVPKASVNNVTVELPRDPSHGDMATNLAMVLAKPLAKKPRDIAEAVKSAIMALPHVHDVSIAGPGFINITFVPEFWQQEIAVILRDQLHYGDSDMGHGESVNVEYVSANPTGPLHIGHARGAVAGDALATLLEKTSHDVTREYYINDAGSQIDTLARSAYARYREAYGENIIIADGMYPGEYLKDVAQDMKVAFGGTLLNESESVWLPEVRIFAVEQLMELIRHDLASLGIAHDVFTSEQMLRDEGWVERGIEQLQAHSLVYRGTLEPPKGKLPDDWEEAEQTLFKSTNFGDDSDRPIVKSNGEYTYFAADIGYSCHKLSRGFDRLVMMLGADHGGYVSRMKALIGALSDKQVPLSVQLCQLVKLLEDGTPVKMSKRSGSFVTVRDMVDDVGKDALRFMMLTRKSEQALDFDVKKVKEQTRENPVFYVQYAHARCKSLLRLAQEQQPSALALSARADKVKLSLLSSADELTLIKLLASFPRYVEAAASAYEPHRLAYYTQDVAAAFHAFWNKGGDDKALRFIHEDNAELTTARLALARSVAIVIAASLHVLGVTPVDELR